MVVAPRVIETVSSNLLHKITVKKMESPSIDAFVRVATFVNKKKEILIYENF